MERVKKVYLTPAILYKTWDIIEEAIGLIVDGIFTNGNINDTTVESFNLKYTTLFNTLGFPEDVTKRLDRLVLSSLIGTEQTVINKLTSDEVTKEFLLTSSEVVFDITKDEYDINFSNIPDQNGLKFTCLLTNPNLSESSLEELKEKIINLRRTTYTTSSKNRNRVRLNIDYPEILDDRINANEMLYSILLSVDNYQLKEDLTSFFSMCLKDERNPLPITIDVIKDRLVISTELYYLKEPAKFSMTRRIKRTPRKGINIFSKLK